jgi:hypothetical protein
MHERHVCMYVHSERAIMFYATTYIIHTVHTVAICTSSTRAVVIVMASSLLAECVRPPTVAVVLQYVILS